MSPALEMEFRLRCTTRFSHFCFYPDLATERDAIEQVYFVRDRLGELLEEAGVDHVIGAHLTHCYKQCGFKENSLGCIADLTSKKRTWKYPNGRCLILPEPYDRSTIENHLPILIYCPSNSVLPSVDADDFTPSPRKISKFASSAEDHKDAGSSGGFAISSSKCTKLTENDTCCGTSFTGESATNWRFEENVKMVKDFFLNEFLHKFGQCGYHVHQRNVWCPFSIWASFRDQDFARVQGRIFKEIFESAYESNEKLCNKILFPKRAPKVKARKQWELVVIPHVKKV